MEQDPETPLWSGPSSATLPNRTPSASLMKLFKNLLPLVPALELDPPVDLVLAAAAALPPLLSRKLQLPARFRSC